jgi:hypothetical protein
VDALWTLEIGAGFACEGFGGEGWGGGGAGCVFASGDCEDGVGGGVG